MKLYVLLFALLKYSECANILCYFISPSISHQVVYQKIWKELSLRGHQVTVITPNPLKDPSLVNLTEIDVNISYKAIPSEQNEIIKADATSMLRKIFMEYFSRIFKIQTSNPEVDRIFKNKDNKKYDLILVEAFYPVAYALGNKYNCPVIGLMSAAGMKFIERAVGNPSHPVAYPDMMVSDTHADTLLGRLYRTYMDIKMFLLYNWELMPEMDKIAREYFGNDIPYLGDIEKNVSLIIESYNLITSKPKATVPNLIYLSNIHIKRNTNLDKGLKKFLDEAKEGVIYFSLGSNIKSVNISQQLKDVIISTFSELPYKILWKWESDYLSKKPDNVITMKWFNQEGVLAHPNVKLFITQGGLQSLEEAVFYKVPLLGMPFVADQGHNVEMMVEAGLALSVNKFTVTKDELKTKILEVINNKKYLAKVSETSDIMFDQPMTGLETAVWWIEYVMRHKGAKHLRNPLVEMPLYQYLLLDLVALVLGIITIGIIFVVITLRYIIRIFCVNKRSNKIKSS